MKEVLRVSGQLLVTVRLIQQNDHFESHEIEQRIALFSLFVLYMQWRFLLTRVLITLLRHVTW